MRRLLVGQEEQEIDVRERRHLATPVAADRDDRHLFPRGRVGERIDRLDGEVVERPDQLIHEEALLADRPVGRAVGVEPAVDLGVAPGERRLERRQQHAPVERRGRRVADRRRQRFAERPPVDDVALPQDVGHHPLKGAARRRR
jgi:hypothetical protein